MRARDRHYQLWLAAILLVALGLRLALASATPLDLLPCARAGWEEQLRGNAAHEFLAGPLLPVFEYQWNALWGGSLVAAVCAVPGFALFGETLFTLRLPPLLISLAGIFLIARVLEFAAGRRAALIGAALLACAPPVYLLTSSQNWGTHAESGVLALWLWQRAQRARRLSPFWLGLGAGAALSFGLALALFLAAFAVAFRRECRLAFTPRARAWPRFGAGLALGLAPLALYFVQVGVRGSSAAQWLDLTAGLRGEGERLARSFRSPDLLERALRVPPVLSGATLMGLGAAGLLALLYLGCALFGLRSAAADGPVAQRSRVLLRVYWLGFWLALASTGFAIRSEHGLFGLRYLALLWPFVALATALALERGFAGGRLARGCAGGLLALFCLSGVSAAAGHCRWQPEARSWRLPAYSLERYGRFLCDRFWREPEAVRAIIERSRERRAPEPRAAILFALGQSLRALLLLDGDVPSEDERRQIRATLAVAREEAPPDCRAYFEEPLPGEPRFGPSDRARFLRWRREHARD